MAVEMFSWKNVPDVGIERGRLHAKRTRFRSSYRARVMKVLRNFFSGDSYADLIKPNIRDTVEKTQFQSFTEPKRPQFNEGEKVMLTSREKTGSLSYKITTRDQGNWCRHADQMLNTSFERTQPSESTSDVLMEIRGPNVTGRIVLETTDAQPATTQLAPRYPVPNRKPPDRLSYQ